MHRCRLLRIAPAAALAAALLAGGAAAAAVGSRLHPRPPVTTVGAALKPPPFPSLPGLWSHAEINVTVRRVPHTLILDRGRIADVAADHVVVIEADGSQVQIPLTAATFVTVDGATVTTSNLARRMAVDVMRIDGGAAVRVRARTPLR